MRELPESGRIQGARSVSRHRAPERRAAAEGRRDAQLWYVCKRLLSFTLFALSRTPSTGPDTASWQAWTLGIRPRNPPPHPPRTLPSIEPTNTSLSHPGNHAQALALAARTRGIPAHIVMPSISTPSKIAATRSYGANVIFSGSTSQEREAVVAEVMSRTGATLVPPYDHPNIILGQGTLALEMEAQVGGILGRDAGPGVDGVAGGDSDKDGNANANANANEDGGRGGKRGRGLNAIVAPCGGGGMLSGIATALSGTGTAVFGAEPSFQGADDARRGLAAGTRVTSVRSLTVADGLRTPVGAIPWSVISDPAKVRAVYAVSERQIKAALRLVLERMKVVIEPSAAVGLAAVLFDEGFRRVVEREGGEEGWNVGVVFSGGNTTVEAIGRLFAATGEAENVAG
jgi:threonine dehydratase